MAGIATEGGVAGSDRMHVLRTRETHVQTINQHSIVASTAQLERLLVPLRRQIDTEMNGLRLGIDRLDHTLDPTVVPIRVSRSGRRRCVNGSAPSRQVDSLTRHPPVNQLLAAHHGFLRAGRAWRLRRQEEKCLADA